MKTIYKKIDTSEVISFNLFDTLLVRPYLKSTDMLLHLEKINNKSGFYAERIKAEINVLANNKIEDVTLDLIYENLPSHFQEMKYKEIEWDNLVLRANPYIKQLFNYSVEKNKKIVIISDCFYSKSFVESLLEKNGYKNYSCLYISNNEKISKKSGSLFFKISTDFNVSHNLILHIGCDEKYDHIVPNNIGIKTYIVKKLTDEYLNDNPKAMAFYKESRNFFGASILLGFLSYRSAIEKLEKNKRNYWQNLGYEYTGPLVFSYMSFVKKEAIRNNIQQLLFIARSGYVLKKVFDCFGEAILTNYVYAPRILKSLCYLDFPYENDKENILRFFLEKSSVLSERYNKSRVDKNFNAEVFYESNFEIIKKIAEKNTKFFNKYISEIVKDITKKIAIVDDMALRFSAQFLLEKVIQQKITGYYFSVVNSEECDNYNYSCFSNSFYKQKVTGSENFIFSLKWRFVEFLLSAPESPIESVDKNGVVHKKDVCKQELFRININEITSNYAEKFAIDFNELFSFQDCFIEYPVIISWINNFLTHPSKEDYINLNKIYWDHKTTNSDLQKLITKSNIFSWCSNVFNKYKISVKQDFYWPSIGYGFVFKYINNLLDRSKLITIFGIPLLNKKYRDNSYSKINSSIISNFLGGLIQKEENINDISYKFLGKEFCRKRNLTDYQKISFKHKDIKIINQISSNTSALISIAFLHNKTFSKYKNLYNGKTIVLYGGGPSSKYFEYVNDAIYVGLNRVFFNKKIKFDYLFASEKSGLVTSCSEFYDDFFSYNAIKFIGDKNSYMDNHIPESILNKYEGINRYRTGYGIISDNFALDLCTEPLGDFNSVALQAMQFILYTNPKKIYLVGLDCTSHSPFPMLNRNLNINRSLINNSDELNIYYWSILKRFLNNYYPETKVISINPVGLRGMFEDCYTETYVSSNTDLCLDDIVLYKHI